MKSLNVITVVACYQMVIKILVVQIIICIF